MKRIALLTLRKLPFYAILDRRRPLLRKKGAGLELDS